MKSLGVEIKSSTCVLVLLDSADEIKEATKIELEDPYCATSVKEFFDDLKTWLEKCNADVVNIKKRLEKGKFAGGASSFKIEGLIQLAALVSVNLVGGPELNRLAKSVETLPAMKKYQEQAYLAALSAL
ncbi:hypothetical protein LNTAR_20883 [Lentisphaera araneosa HTCC2155]|uniref:Uncharacterized protein n=1 Tax=Lentisphaera araneosa HTCC2155 TaxID=313628 RepID=A6DL99_9BACT|nr:DUF3010 family protein [Lentisphaera araneosa]EDM27701.1 hypothetical protein LNTAR_20883 [Lentisphaera araneosa HTCC2155]